MLKKFTYFAVFLFILFISSSVFALSPSSEEIYKGIDVSNWQGHINYNEVKAERNSNCIY